jgi:hypothetical protein
VRITPDCPSVRNSKKEAELAVNWARHSQNLILAVHSNIGYAAIGPESASKKVAAKLFIPQAVVAAIFFRFCLGKAQSGASRKLGENHFISAAQDL